MPLFEVTGTTPRKTVFPIAFGLASSESQEAFTWLARQLRDLFTEIGLQLTGDARQIHVIITDDDRGMKAALSEVFPDIQQQLCRWHIQKNALKNLAEKWIRSDTPQPETRTHSGEEHTYFGLHEMWRSVYTAEDLTTMRQKWTALCQEFEASQPGLYMQFPPLPN